MVHGLIGLIFKDGITEEEIQDIISEIYKKNCEDVLGMQYIEFRDDKTLGVVLGFIDTMNVPASAKKTPKYIPQIENADRFIQGTVAALDIVAIYDNPTIFKDIVEAAGRRAVLAEIAKNGLERTKVLAKNEYGR